jgi:hypothetical protein
VHEVNQDSRRGEDWCAGGDPSGVSRLKSNVTAIEWCRGWKDNGRRDDEDVEWTSVPAGNGPAGHPLEATNEWKDSWRDSPHLIFTRTSLLVHYLAR